MYALTTLHAICYRFFFNSIFYIIRLAVLRFLTTSIDGYVSMLRKIRQNTSRHVCRKIEGSRKISSTQSILNNLQIRWNKRTDKLNDPNAQRKKNMTRWILRHARAHGKQQSQRYFSQFIPTSFQIMNYLFRQTNISIMI